MQPNGVNFRYFNFRPFDLKEFRLWNIRSTTLCCKDLRIIEKVCGKNSVPLAHPLILQVSSLSSVLKESLFSNPLIPLILFSNPSIPLISFSNPSILLILFYSLILECVIHLFILIVLLFSLVLGSCSRMCSMLSICPNFPSCSLTWL